jgi:hypothetical protein
MMQEREVRKLKRELELFLPGISGKNVAKFSHSQSSYLKTANESDNFLMLLKTGQKKAHKHREAVCCLMKPQKQETRRLYGGNLY